MLRHGIAAMIGLAALSGAPAKAAEDSAFLIDTTADLARLCGASSTHPNFVAAIHMCHGYLVGVHHFHTALAAELDDDIYCIERVDPRPSRQQVVAAFVTYVQDTPGVGELEALEGLLSWAAASYPCGG